jgi:hypothetical protein
MSQSTEEHMLPIARRIGMIASVVALIAAACGDDGLDAGTTTSVGASTTTSSAQPETTSTLPDETGPTDTTQPTTTEPDPPVGSEEVAALIEEYQRVPLRVTYLVGEGPAEQTVTLAQDPQQVPPVSAVIMYSGPESESPEQGRVITIGERTIVCGPPGPGNTCFEATDTSEGGVGVAAAALGPLFSMLLVMADLTEIPGLTVEENPVTIAGRQGVCFTYAAGRFVGAGAATVRHCLDAELGFTLRIHAEDADGATLQKVMELIDFAQPRPEDFEPTGEVVSQG